MTERYQIYQGKSEPKTSKNESYKRRLSAVFSADVKGYSKMMGVNEDKTVATITFYRKLMSSIVQKNGGRVIDSVGDNMLAEFNSVSDAIEAAVEVQNSIKEKNKSRPKNEQMRFRIGINVGEIITEGARIYGDGVNIAARLEGIAEPGGICISGTAYEHSNGKTPYHFNYLGKQKVKNIATPVKAYSLEMNLSRKLQKNKILSVEFSILIFILFALIFNYSLKFVAADFGFYPFEFLNNSWIIKAAGSVLVLVVLVSSYFSEFLTSAKVIKSLKKTAFFFATMVLLKVGYNFSSFENSFLENDILKTEHQIFTASTDSIQVFGENKLNDNPIDIVTAGTTFLIPAKNNSLNKTWITVSIKNNVEAYINIKKLKKEYFNIDFYYIKYVDILVISVAFMLTLAAVKIKMLK